MAWQTLLKAIAKVAMNSSADGDNTEDAKPMSLGDIASIVKSAKTSPSDEVDKEVAKEMAGQKKGGFLDEQGGKIASLAGSMSGGSGGNTTPIATDEQIAKAVAGVVPDVETAGADMSQLGNSNKSPLEDFMANNYKEKDDGSMIGSALKKVGTGIGQGLLDVVEAKTGIGAGTALRERRAKLNQISRNEELLSAAVKDNPDLLNEFSSNLFKKSLAQGKTIKEASEIVGALADYTDIDTNKDILALTLADKQREDQYGMKTQESRIQKTMDEAERTKIALEQDQATKQANIDKAIADSQRSVIEARQAGVTENDAIRKIQADADKAVIDAENAGNTQLAAQLKINSDALKSYWAEQKAMKEFYDYESPAQKREAELKQTSANREATKKAELNFARKVLSKDLESFRAIDDKIERGTGLKGRVKAGASTLLSRFDQSSPKGFAAATHDAITKRLRVSLVRAAGDVGNINIVEQKAAEAMVPSIYDSKETAELKNSLLRQLTKAVDSNDGNEVRKTIKKFMESKAYDGPKSNDFSNLWGGK